MKKKEASTLASFKGRHKVNSHDLVIGLEIEIAKMKKDPFWKEGLQKLENERSSKN